MARPTYSQRFYEIAIERDEASIANGTATQDQIDRLPHYKKELLWWVTGKREAAVHKPRRAIGSDDLVHSMEQTADFIYCCHSESPDTLPAELDHRLFTAPDGRHLHVRTRFGRQNVSVRRFAYAVLHPEDPFTEQDDIMVTCQHVGDNDTGNGVCINHLKKVPAYAARSVRSLALPGSGGPTIPVVPYSSEHGAAACL